MNATHRYPNSSILVISHSLTFQEVIQLGQPIDLWQRSSQLCYTIKAFSSQRREGSLVKNTQHWALPRTTNTSCWPEPRALLIKACDFALYRQDISCLGRKERKGKARNVCDCSLGWEHSPFSLNVEAVPTPPSDHQVWQRPLILKASSCTGSMINWRCLQL